MVDTPTGSHLVYHRKVSGDPGWADREICSAPLGWDEAGYPVVGSPGGGSTGSIVGLAPAAPREGFDRLSAWPSGALGPGRGDPVERLS